MTARSPRFTGEAQEKEGMVETLVGMVAGTVAAPAVDIVAECPILRMLGFEAD